MFLLHDFKVSFKCWFILMSYRSYEAKTLEHSKIASFMIFWKKLVLQHFESVLWTNKQIGEFKNYQLSFTTVVWLSSLILSYPSENYLSLAGANFLIQLGFGAFHEFCVSQNAWPPKNIFFCMKLMEHIPMTPNNMNLAIRVLQKVSILKMFKMT